MSRISAVVSFKRRVDQDSGAQITEVVTDEGDGDASTAPFFQPVGEDSQPLPGDEVALDESSGSGAEVALACADVRNAGKSGPGEKRIYSRDASGSVVAEVWLKADGTVHVITAAAVLVGKNPAQAWVLGDKLVQWLQALTVPTAMGPSGTPINAATLSTIISSRHKVDG
jgi:hypothetical protein